MYIHEYTNNKYFCMVGKTEKEWKTSCLVGNSSLLSNSFRTGPLLVASQINTKH